MIPKYQQIAAQLRSDIHEGMYHSVGHLPTEMQLCAQYDVSRQTIRQALALLEADKLIEKRQGSGSHIRKAAIEVDSNVIAIVTSYVNDYIFPSLLQDVQNVLGRFQYATLVYNTANQVSREREILLELLERPVRGILIEGVKTVLPNPNIDLYVKLKNMGTKIVFLHGNYPEFGGVCISDDNESGGYIATQYLIEKGHRSIAGLFKFDDIQGVQRYNGMMCAMRDADLPLMDSRIMWYGTAERQLLMDYGKNDWLKIFLHTYTQNCTAIICYNDEIAYPLVQLLLDEGVRIPSQMAVISFDNSFYSEMGAIHITSLAHDAGKLGRQAAQTLLQLIHGQAVVSEQLTWQLVEKEST